MGVVKSEDGGMTFRRIFCGLEGKTADFHAMTISPANPKILYGWFLERLYVSKDGGKSWQFASAQGIPQQGFCFGAPCLSADSEKESSVYAGTPGGLLVSRDLVKVGRQSILSLGQSQGLGFILPWYRAIS